MYFIWDANIIFVSFIWDLPLLFCELSQNFCCTWMLSCLIERLMKKNIFFPFCCFQFRVKYFCQSSPGYRKNRVILYFILENHDLSYESWYALSRRHVRARFVIDFLDVIASSRSTPRGESSILRLAYRYVIDGYKNPAPFGWVLLAIAWAAFVARRATFVDASALVILPSKTRWISPTLISRIEMDACYFCVAHCLGISVA